MHSLAKTLVARTEIAQTLARWLKHLALPTLLLGSTLCNSAPAAFLISLGLGTPIVTGDQASIAVNLNFQSSDPAAPDNDFINAVFVDFSGSSAALQSNDYSRISVENVLADWQFLGIGSDGVSGVAALDPSAYITSSLSPVRLFELKIDLLGLSQGVYSVSIFKQGSTDASGQIAQFDETTQTWSPVVFSSFNNYPTDSGATPGTINFNDPGTVRFETSTSNVVPEPATWIIVVTGASLFALRRRRSERNTLL